MAKQDSGRTPDAHVDELFLRRWSPIAFSDRSVAANDLASLFEAARWAPSSYNEQPWRFVYADNEETLAKFRPLIMEGNRLWSDKAPVLLFVFAKRRLERTGRENLCAEFDTGAATLALSLQAVRLGLSTHAMAGVYYDKVYEALEVPEEEYQVICAMAIGYHDSEAELPPDLASRETLSSRKPTSEIAFLGSLAN